MHVSQSQILTVRRDETEDGVLLVLAGEIDLSSVPVLRDSLATCVQGGADAVDVDLTSVTFCDCAGLGTFIEAQRRLGVTGGVLRLHHPRPALVHLLAATRTAHQLLVMEPRSAPATAEELPAGGLAPQQT